MSKDLYAVLGLDRAADAAQIKKAYRNLSKEWHPDKHKGDKAAEQRFKEINEAYEILGNDDKKKRYDQFGSMGGAGGNGGFENMDFSGFGSNFGDLSDLFQGFFGGGGGRRKNRDQGRDLEVEIRIPLRDTLKVSQHELRLTTFAACETCNGSGGAPDSKKVTCTVCNGSGQVTRSAQSFFGVIQQSSICDRCGGSGKIPEVACKTCGGEGRTERAAPLTVEIPAGVDDGQTLRVRSRGEAGRRGAGAGDLYVHVRVQSDPQFERKGGDVRSTITISVLDAILGAEAEVETLHGKDTVRIPEALQPGQVLRIKGKGIPILGSHRTGDHYVRVNVEIPKKLSRAERKLLEEWRGLRD